MVAGGGEPSTYLGIRSACHILFYEACGVGGQVVGRSLIFWEEGSVSHY